MQKKDTIELLLDAKSKILTNAGIHRIDVSCAITDLIMAAHAVGEIEAIEEIERDKPYAQKRLTEYMDKINHQIDKTKATKNAN